MKNKLTNLMTGINIPEINKQVIIKANKDSPINNTLFVQEPQTGDNFGCIKPGPALIKPSTLLNVEHEIAAIQVLHNKK